MVAHGRVRVSRRASFGAADATSEGSRQLRELLRKQTFGSLARRLRCDERSVRWWASERFKPSRLMRARMFEVVAIPEDAWDVPPSSDLYAGEDPATTRRT